MVRTSTYTDEEVDTVVLVIYTNWKSLNIH